MDTITRTIAGSAGVWIAVVCIVGLVSVGLGLYWLFSKQARLRLAELRKKLDDLEPTDPEYGAVRALYTSMLIDAERWDFLPSESGSSDHSESTHDSGGGHIGDGGAGGDHH
ncbi:MAG TPA: hypothetical protein VGC77_08625 [Rhodopseudomonas sp.]|uniref:hypothetical protein n=1 Tax=Rhodopseudomonas sp. TaxID=1078 RepID=UPI002ED8B6B6